MPYVQRDDSGRITSLYRDAPHGQAELLAADHPDILSFLDNGTGSSNNQEVRRLLSNLDTTMIRVLDDLVEVLIQKRVIMLTDLPEQAQKKVLLRKETRENLLGDPESLYMGHNDIL
jgi:ABC-type nitrate/sulfonate/bicarbonate transport system ATPase subunit